MKKKIVCIVILLVFLVACVGVLTACNPDEHPGDTVKITVIAPDGAPALALAKMMSEKATKEGYEISFRVVNASLIGAEALKEDVDFAIMPTNAAAMLYNRGQKLKLVSTNTQGNLFMIGKGEATSLNDLVGKVVYNIGREAVPDLTFKAILDKKGIAWAESDVSVEGKVALTYAQDGQALIPLLIQGKAEYGILGEPAVSQALGKSEALKRIFNLQNLWNEVTSTENGFPQAGMVVKDKMLENHKEFVKWFMEQCKANDAWVLAHPADAEKAIKDNGSANAVTLTEAALQGCNLNTRLATGDRTRIEAYLEVFKDKIGGNLPNDAFYVDLDAE